MATAKKNAPAEPKSPRQIKSKMVKEKICAAATDLIKSHGYEYVTVSNVCNAAEVSVGSFYHHFTNKDDLLGYYLTAAFENYAAEFENISGDDVVSNVVRCFGLYIDFLLEQGLEVKEPQPQRKLRPGQLKACEYAHPRESRGVHNQGAGKRLCV